MATAIPLSASPQEPPCITAWGPTPYQEAWDRQRALWQARVALSIPDTLVCCEHPPTVTLGRHAPATDLVMPSPELQRRGVAVVRSDRGGRATVHGPGQAVVYPIVHVGRLGLAPRPWVRLLEDAVLEALNDYGVTGQRHEGRPGLWTNAGKIASLGLRISRGVSYHGLAINVDLDVSLFDCIVPCGVVGERITTLAAEQGPTTPTCAAVAARVSTAISNRIEAMERS